MKWCSDPLTGISALTKEISESSLILLLREDIGGSAGCEQGRGARPDTESADTLILGSQLPELRNKCLLPPHKKEKRKKRCSTSLIIREMKIITVMRCQNHLSEEQLSKSNKLQVLMDVQRKGNVCVLLVGRYCGSAGKESTCNVGDLGSIPGLGRAPGEGNSYPLQYSGLENFVGREACWATVSPWGCKESDMTEPLSPCIDRCSELLWGDSPICYWLRDFVKYSIHKDS